MVPKTVLLEEFLYLEVKTRKPWGLYYRNFDNNVCFIKNGTTHIRSNFANFEIYLRCLFFTLQRWIMITWLLRLTGTFWVLFMKINASMHMWFNLEVGGQSNTTLITEKIQQTKIVDMRFFLQITKLVHAGKLKVI